MFQNILELLIGPEIIFYLVSVTDHFETIKQIRDPGIISSFV